MLNFAQHKLQNWCILPFQEINSSPVQSWHWVAYHLNYHQYISIFFSLARTSGHGGDRIQVADKFDFLRAVFFIYCVHVLYKIVKNPNRMAYKQDRYKSYFRKQTITNHQKSLGTLIAIFLFWGTMTVDPHIVGSLGFVCRTHSYCNNVTYTGLGTTLNSWKTRHSVHCKFEAATCTVRASFLVVQVVCVWSVSRTSHRHLLQRDFFFKKNIGIITTVAQSILLKYRLTKIPSIECYQNGRRVVFSQ